MSRLKKYQFSYRLDNEDWDVIVPAKSEEHAKAIIARLTVAQFKGEVRDKIWLVRLTFWLLQKAGIMKVILITSLAIFMAGCVSTSYQKDGTKISYTDLFKKANDVNIQWGDVGIQIGGISSELTAEDIAAYLKVMGALSVK